MKMKNKPKALSFDRLRRVNVRRTEEVFHPLNDWSPTDWACAMGGEAGEALNKVKKLRRLDGADKRMDSPAMRRVAKKAIAKELADTVLYADLLAARLEIDLGEAVRAKFNEVSRFKGSRERL